MSVYKLEFTVNYLSRLEDDYRFIFLVSFGQKFESFWSRNSQFRVFSTAVLAKNIFWAGAAMMKMVVGCWIECEWTDGHCGRMKHELSGSRLIFLLTPPPQIWPHHIHVHILIYLSLSASDAGLNKWHDCI